jgi:hypothetical protein
MKKLLLFVALLGLLAACSKTEPTDIVVDKWNGYEDFYKMGEMYRDLRIRHHVIGTVTYGIDDNANFYVTYETDGDWELVKTHMFAGEWKNKPRRKHHSPKLPRFPYKTNHNPYVTTYTYTIPLTQLPPAEEPGFVVAANAIVYNSNKCGDNDYKEAWADWDRKFRCSGWGGYSIYYYNEPYEPHTTYYSVEYDGGDLNVFLVDATDGVYDTILTEPGVGNPSTDDGASVDPLTGYIFYTNYSDGNLYVNLQDEDETPSYAVGPLEGTVKSATYYDGTFYYINETVNNSGETVNEIREVTVSVDPTTSEFYFNSSDDVVVGIIPSTFTAINDITFDPTSTGDLYLIGETGDGNAQLLVYDQTAQTLTNTVITDAGGSPVIISSNPQIAFTDGGDLYMVNAADPSGDIVSILTASPGVVTYTVEEPIVEVPFPFAALGGNVTVN